MSAWRTVRVFISSTFRDMHAERDHLVKVVFPALRERLEPYRVHLIDVDLRWGVTREQAENQQVVGFCLDQARSCQAFVGILGQRYGWVPAAFPPALLRAHPWVEGHQGSSVTELEVLHGALEVGPGARPAFFYFRDLGATDGVPEPARGETFVEPGEGAARRLAALKERVRGAGLPLMDGYPARWDAQAYDRPSRTRGRLAGLEEFGRRLGEDLWQAVRSELRLPERPPVAHQEGPLAEEDDHHERFMESRLRVYVGREQTSRDLLAFAEGDGAGACLVVGPSGAGKSAALARFVADYRERHRQALVVPHFVGAGPRSTGLRDMLRRFCLALRGRFAPAEEVPDEAGKLAVTFQELLGKIPSSGRVLFVIDALNQLDEADGAHGLHWLPAQPPPQARFVVSCIAEPGKPERVREPSAGTGGRWRWGP